MGMTVGPVFLTLACGKNLSKGGGRKTVFVFMEI